MFRALKVTVWHCSLLPFRYAPFTASFIEKLDVNADDTVTFDKIIAVGKDSGLEVGAPYVSGATVEAKVIKNGKAKKITVFTYKPKKGSSHRKQGHRQPYTKVRIDAVKA